MIPTMPIRFYARCCSVVAATRRKSDGHGDIGELGDSSWQEHHDLGRDLAELSLDHYCSWTVRSSCSRGCRLSF